MTILVPSLFLWELTVLIYMYCNISVSVYPITRHLPCLMLFRHPLGKEQSGAEFKMHEVVRVTLALLTFIVS